MESEGQTVESDDMDTELENERENKDPVIVSMKPRNIIRWWNKAN